MRYPWDDHFRAYVLEQSRLAVAVLYAISALAAVRLLKKKLFGNVSRLGNIAVAIPALVSPVTCFAFEIAVCLPALECAVFIVAVVAIYRSRAAADCGPLVYAVALFWNWAELAGEWFDMLAG